MTALDKTPTNQNFLSNLNFEVRIRKLPHVVFFLQDVSLPGVTLPDTQYPNPFVKIPIHGDHMEYEDFNITFKIDEDLRNYTELHTWIRQLGFPTQFGEFANIDSQSQISGLGKYSDISLFISTNLSNPNIEIIFRDAFPISISRLNFGTTSEDVMYLEADATFKYTYFDIEYIT